MKPSVRNMHAGNPAGFFLIISALMIFTVLNLLSFSYASEDNWSGVDESVVEKFAGEHGRASVDPLINTDQGDLLLFVFLFAGAIGGFIGGYYWRVLISEKRPGNKTAE